MADGNLDMTNMTMSVVFNDVIPVPKKIIYSNTYTIVQWEDGTKTSVQCSDGDNFHEDMGFLAALGKKIYGHRNTYMKYIGRRTYRPDYEARDEKILDKKLAKVAKEVGEQMLISSGKGHWPSGE